MPSRRNSAFLSPGAARRGTAAIEFGIFAPFLIVLLTATIEIGYCIYQTMQVGNAASAGLIFASKNGWDANGIASAVVNGGGPVAVSAYPPPAQFCGCAGAGGVVAAQCGATCGSGAVAGHYIRIDARAPRSSIIPGTGLPLSPVLTAQRIYRQY